MNSQSSNRPGYVGQDWTTAPQGYCYISTVPDLKKTNSQSSWDQLLYIFEEAKSGTFNSTQLLVPLIEHSTDFHLTISAIRLLGDIGCDEDLLCISNLYSHTDEDIRLAAYTATFHSSSCQLLERLINHAETRKRGIELDLLTDCVSESLEWEPDILFEPKSILDFQNNARSLFTKVTSKIGANIPILYGDLLNIKNIVEKLRCIAYAPDAQSVGDNAVEYLLRFEAMTGLWDFDWFLDSGEVNFPSIINSINHFEKTKLAGRLEPGVRYFFGHPVR